MALFFFFILDGGLLLALLIVGALFIFGSADLIAGFILSNLGLVITIAVIFAALSALWVGWFTKKISCGLCTAAQLSGVLFFAIYGIYRLSLYHQEHPFLAILVFFVYLLCASAMLYVPLGILSECDLEELDGGEAGAFDLVFIVLAIITWVFNWFVFKVCLG